MKKLLLSLLTIACLGTFTVPVSASTLNLGQTEQKATVSSNQDQLTQQLARRYYRTYDYDYYYPGYYYSDRYYYGSPYYYYNPGVQFYLGW